MSGGSSESALRSEIASFYAGFGQPELLRRALGDTLLIVPVTDDDRVWTSTVRGVHWLCAFTSVEEYARFQVKRAVAAENVYRHHTIRGQRLIEYAAGREKPTGLLVDIAGSQPMAFPPTVTDSGERVVAGV